MSLHINLEELSKELFDDYPRGNHMTCLGKIA